VNKNLKLAVVLLASMVLLVTGVNAGLGHLTRSEQQGSFTIYNDRGQAVFAYEGDLSACRELAKPAVLWPTRFLHRT
jgi:hypothetical protein